MNFGLTYDDLTPVAGKVRAGIVAYDGDNPAHRAILREAVPRFLGSLGAVHREAFPRHHIDAVMEVADAKEIEIEFFNIALDICCPILICALATGAPTFGAECDENNNLRIFPFRHGEDLCVDKDIAALFREYTKCQLYPDGIGAGTWFMREQIRRSVIDPDWVFAGRDNEHSPENPAILGLMNKFGAVHGTEDNSPVLQTNGLTDDMIDRLRCWRVPVELQKLPAYGNGLEVCDNNFLTRWSSDDGKQQIMVIYTKIVSTFDGKPVVWTKIKSNGHLPDAPILQDVMASLLSAGCTEISERHWGSPRIITERFGLDTAYILGGPVPVMHLHMNREPEIMRALLKMGAAYRKFGNHTMLSGIINPRRASKSVFGYELPDATEVNGIDPERDANNPIPDFGPVPNKPRRSKVTEMPLRGSVKPVGKNNLRSCVAA